MNFRVQRLHPPAEHLGPSRQIGNIADRDSILAQKTRRAPSRNDLDAERRELPRKISKPALVIHTHQRAFHGHGILRRPAAKRLL